MRTISSTYTALILIGIEDNIKWYNSFIFSVPPPKMFAYFNPIQLCMDHLTVLWLNAFALNLQRSVKMLAVEQTEPPYLDVKIEAIMLRVRFHKIILNGRGRRGHVFCVCFDFSCVRSFHCCCFITRHYNYNPKILLWRFKTRQPFFSTFFTQEIFH